MYHPRVYLIKLALPQRTTSASPNASRAKRKPGQQMARSRWETQHTRQLRPTRSAHQNGGSQNTTAISARRARSTKSSRNHRRNAPAAHHPVVPEAPLPLGGVHLPSGADAEHRLENQVHHLLGNQVHH